MSVTAPAVSTVIAKLNAFVARVSALIVIEVTSELIESTPVDTGWARANWIPSVGAPKSSPAGSRDSVTTSAQQAGLGVVRGYALGGPLFIANNVPYIGDLNNGTSKQAPAAFVQSSIVKGVATASVAARALGRSLK